MWLISTISGEDSMSNYSTSWVVYPLYILVFVLIYYICIFTFHHLKRRNNGDKISRLATKRMIIVLGSGGHTTEMVAMIKNIDIKFYYRITFMISEGDRFSKHKIEKSFRKHKEFDLSLFEQEGKVEY